MKKLAIIFLISLSACSIGKHPESSIYSLKPMEVEAQSCKLNLNLQIAEPTAAPGLSTRRIAVYEDAQHLNYYTGTLWVAPAPEMLQAALVEGFEKARAFKSVSTDADATDADIILLTDIRSYQVMQHSVKIHFVSKLIDSETRSVLATIPIEKTAHPRAYKMQEIVETFSAATNDAVKEVIEKGAVLDN